ncbi:hypothetical protein ACFY0F_23380 [Streptomyces sp. NPDC001544]|uniref:hypothetical protein n=1 Tax=Streptomyces sp. NPDC001544 TaxID=3364584 RepID=UPI003685F66C
MSTYQGEVVVVDGQTETSMTARLRKGLSGSWDGVLPITTAEQWEALKNLMQATLRLPSGEEAAFIVPALPQPPNPNTVLRIEGNGDAPF